jgi:hypothetical protein
MKKLVFTFLLLSVSAFVLKAQKQEDQKTPDEQIIVNKKFDEQGNLIQYDSTYIHKWSTDTTFRFGFPDDGMSYDWNFPGIKRFMNEFWSDTVFGSPSLSQQPFSFGFRFSPFDDEELRKGRRSLFPDSLFAGNFPFQFDSLFFNFPSPKNHPGFDQKFMEDFEKRLNEHFFQFRADNFSFPHFKNEEHHEEWKQLMEKHQKELENLRKKWEEN